MAAPPKSHEPASDKIMSAEKMKPLLMLSKHEPLSAAIALTTDGDGIILLDKKAKPRKAMAMMHAAAGKAKLQLNAATIRFGRAEVDPDYDSAMVRFFINKDAPGNMRIKLVEVVRHANFQKVEINVDPSLESEPEHDEDGETEAEEADGVEAPPTNTSVATPVQAAPPDMSALAHELAALVARIAGVGGDAEVKARLVALANAANVAIKAHDLGGGGEALGRLRAALDAPRAPAVTAPGAHDPAELAHALAVLVKRIAEVAGADPARRAALAKLANDANGAIKSGSPAEAGAALLALRRALDAGGAPLQTAPRQDLRAIWRDAKESTDDGLNRLAAALRGYEDPDLERIADFGLFGMGGGENVALNKALIEYGQASGEARQAATASVRKAVAAYRAMMAREPMFKLIDANPEVPLQVEVTLAGALTQIEHALA